MGDIQQSGDMCGFSIYLNQDVVFELLATERDPEPGFHGRMNKQIKYAFGEAQARLAPQPEYFGNTWLLRNVGLPGRHSLFCPDGNARLGYNLKYTSHNIDSPLQAACLLSMWLIWFNAVIHATSFKQPISIYT